MEFEDPTRRFPALVVTPTNEENMSLCVVEDDSCNAYRVAWCCSHASDLLLAQCRWYIRLEEL
jgi:hypothetical protein